MKKVVLRVDLPDGKAKQKAMKTVSALTGIDSISVDLKAKQLIVIGTVDPVHVLSKFRKYWTTNIVSVGPAKEPEKKEEPKKEEAKKEEEKKEEPKKEEEAKKEEPKKEEGKKEEPKKEEPKKEEVQMNHLLSTAGQASLPKKKARGPPAAEVEERVVARSSAPPTVTTTVRVPTTQDMGNPLTRPQVESDLDRAERLFEEGGGGAVVRQILEGATLANVLAGKYTDSLKQREKLTKEKDAVEKRVEEVELKMAALSVELEKVRAELVTAKKMFELDERKRRVAEEECRKSDHERAEMKKSVELMEKEHELQLHNSMEGHVSEFIKSGVFSHIGDLHRLPTAIVDVTSITFGVQEEGVEEDGESKIANFKPEVELKWDKDETGRVIFPPKLEFELVAVDEEEVDIVGGAEVADNAQDEMNQEHVIIE